MNNPKIKKNSGFTLVEVMFAIFILTFTITGLMTIVANSLFSARYAKDEITANYLLQEVADYMRNDRDTTAFLKNETWEDFLAKYAGCSADVTYGCYINVSKNLNTEISKNEGVKTCPDKDCYMYYDQSGTEGSFYNYQDLNLDGSHNVKTNFKRKIVVKASDSNKDEIDVIITVDWKNGGKQVERSLTTSLMRWQQ